MTVTLHSRAAPLARPAGVPSFQPGANRARIAYFRHEARRVEVLAAATADSQGRGVFAQAAAEYRALAEALEPQPSDDIMALSPAQPWNDRI